MPRNAGQRGGSRHAKGRKAGPRSGAPAGPKRTSGNRFSLDSFVQEDYESAPLHLGGFRIHCNNGSVEQIQSVRARGGGRGRKGRSNQRQLEESDEDDIETTDNSSLDSDDVADYLANVEPHSTDSNSGQEQGHFLLANFDNHPAADAVEAAEEGLSDFSDSSGESCSESQSDAGSSDNDSDFSIDDMIANMEDGLSLMERYPVLLNEKPPTSNAQGVSSSFKRKQRSAVRGAKNGKLLPGEKKRLKREKMQAKRASRSAAQGLDLEAINAELIHFVTSDGDMKGFPPMNKYGLQMVIKLASCYGLKASAQGSGKKQFVVVASCERTILPSGEAAAEVKRILGQQQQFEAAMRVVNLGSRTGVKPKRKNTGQGSQMQAPRFNVPVSFVSSGCMNTDTMEVRPPMQAATGNDVPSSSQDPEVQADDRSPIEAAALVTDVEPIAQDIAASVAEAPWNSLAPEDDYDAAEPQRLGLGCSALPDHEYQEEVSADASPQSSSRPIYDRFDAAPLGATDRASDVLDRANQAVDCSSGASGEEDTSPVPVGSYIHERRPDLPNVFQTKQEVKRSKKKQEKLARRAQRQQFSAAALVPPAQPTAVATGLYYGKFEQHTTGYGSRMLAKWGFSGQGSGLGRDQQGIAEPVAAVIRPKKLGLGH